MQTDDLSLNGHQVTLNIEATPSDEIDSGIKASLVLTVDFVADPPEFDLE